jgi:hypothetical protein
MTTSPASRRGDFLASVVDRAQDRVASVTPRPASLFEPAHSRVRIADAIDADASKHLARDEAIDAESTRARPADVGAHERPYGPRPPRSALSTRERDDTPAIVRDIATRLPRISEPSDEKSRAQVPALAALANPVESLRSSAPAKASAHDVSFVPLHDGHEARPEPHSIAPRAAVVPPTPRLLANRDAVAAMTPHAADAREARREPAHSSPTPSNVTISIGRLEVRAMTPPTMSSREANPRKPTRLDEYLGRRERAR